MALDLPFGERPESDDQQRRQCRRITSYNVCYTKLLRARRPDDDAVLHRHTAHDGEKPSQRGVRLVGAVRPQAMIAAANGDAVEHSATSTSI